MEQEALKKRAGDRHAEEKGLRQAQVKRLQVNYIRHTHIHARQNTQKKNYQT